MFAAGLSINNIPPLASSIWLGGAGLSICGVLIINYFPVKAFGISNDDLNQAITDGNDYGVNLDILAAAIATPVILALWSSILFLVGIVVCIVHGSVRGAWYKVVALIPVTAGLLACVSIFAVGEVLERSINGKVGSRSGSCVWS